MQVRRGPRHGALRMAEQAPEVVEEEEVKPIEVSGSSPAPGDHDTHLFLLRLGAGQRQRD